MSTKFALLPIILLSTLFACAQPIQLRGTVTDAMCGKHHVMKNASPAECARACVKAGSDFALLSGDKLYTLRGDKAQMDKFAGAEVVVRGDMSGNSITVRQIKVAR